jgi:hypothetical protein
MTAATAAIAAVLVVLVWSGRSHDAAVSTATGRSGTQASSAAWDAGALSAKPLHLAPGVYRYTVTDLSTEVTSGDGSTVLRAAVPGEPRTWRFEMRDNGEWVERTTDAGPPIERAYEGGEHRTVVDGHREDPPSRAAEAAQAERAAREAGSSIAAGGPRIELNPYGASFLLSIEAAQNEDAGRATASAQTVPCGTRTCTMVDFEREVDQPPADAEYYRSLPWSETNTERAVVVYEDDTQLVHRYETSFNGVLLHRFVLDSRP